MLMRRWGSYSVASPERALAIFMPQYQGLFQNENEKRKVDVILCIDKSRHFSLPESDMQVRFERHTGDKSHEHLTSS